MRFWTKTHRQAMAPRRDDDADDDEAKAAHVTPAAMDESKSTHTHALTGFLPMMPSMRYDNISLATADQNSQALLSYTDAPYPSIPTCGICAGFLVSLPCGHDGCLHCLQKVIPHAVKVSVFSSLKSGCISSIFSSNKRRKGQDLFGRKDQDGGYGFKLNCKTL